MVLTVLSEDFSMFFVRLSFIIAELNELKVLCLDRKPPSTIKDNTKKKQMVTFNIKREITEKYEKGAHLIEMARWYGRNTFTICSIIKQKDNFSDIG